MGDTILIETTADEVVSIVTQGPQGPSGAEAATLTTQGDTLYRGLTTNQRLPIGAPGQVLKVNSGATAPEWANESGAVTEVNGQTGAVTLTASDVGAAPSTGIDPTAITGTAVVDSDARLTDSRSPLAHKNSHSVGQADFLAPSDIGAQSIFVTEDLGTITATVTLTAARAKIYTVTINTFDVPTPRVQLPNTGIMAGDVVQIRFTSFTGRQLVVNDGSGNSIAGSTITSGQRRTFIAASTSGTSWAISGVDTHTHAATDITSGTLDIARIPTGTGSTQVALGNHTHADLHTRSHAITSTSDHTAGNHKVFYSNGSGEIVELALGNSGEVLTSNGATSAPSFAAAAAGGSKTYAVFTATDNNPPASSFATIDQRNSIAVLDFDDATDESSVFVGIIPEGASLGSGLKIRLHWMATSATSGDCIWDVSLERMTTDLDSDSFDTIASGTATANGTSGILTVTEITLTTIDSVTAGDGFRLKVTRDANNGSDSLVGDAELVLCEVRSAA